ncbi:LacI family DNA-binding transcriptional regulator [Bartonella sp. HY329]|uniref:LacI family DNA-binding transcriptional regulator n=1 Tax=unclassified Bartonella TaxID=2645622 RepID=UPI0021C6BB6C|nr:MULTISPECIES: LacI family DNA-binding transcriptional regulator [unclassified Bartonella]UXM94432.1 LacI family DNA-binding transcriptional regulator [Bartonella sp. HY329]UXN08756.1 LacI family DNA-binding transcriptional regulator [Bartonella sp. HY328]
MTKKTTLQDIAEAANLSIATVDRVVNRRGGVSPAAEALVLEWASRLDLDRRIFRKHLRNLRIAVMLQSPHNPFYRELRDAFSELNSALTDMKIASFLHYIDITDLKGIRSKIDEIAGSYDGLIIIAPNEAGLCDALRNLANKLPIVTLATDIPNSGRVAYIGPDNRQMGRVAGELMGRFLSDGGGDLLIVVGLSNIAGHEEREMGFRTVLRERFPACNIIGVVESEEDPIKAGDLVGAELKKNPTIRGIYNISAGNTAIVKSIEALGKTGTVKIITHELTESRRKLLRDGLIDVVIDQNPKIEVQQALEVFEWYYQRREMLPPMSNPTPFIIYIRENCPMDVF